MSAEAKRKKKKLQRRRDMKLFLVKLMLQITKNASKLLRMILKFLMTMCGCSTAAQAHTSRNEKFFTTLSGDVGVEVIVANAAKIKIEGSGTIMVKFNGRNFKLEDVSYVPKLKVNLILSLSRRFLKKLRSKTKSVTL